GDTIVIQQAKCVKIWGREGRLGHVEVFLQMCCFVTSIFERPRLFLCLQHARIRKLIYTQNSEEPLAQHPVTHVSQSDAIAYADWAGSASCSLLTALLSSSTNSS